MPNQLPISLPNGISLKKNRHVLAGAGEVSFEIVAQPGSAVLAALAQNAPFPPGKIEFESSAVKVTGNRDVPLGGSRGTVNFTAKGSAYHRLSILDDPAEITALLVRESLNEDLAEGLALERRDGHRFVLLRWGYDLQGAGKGSVALGAGPSVTFGAEGKRLGAYAVVRQFPDTTGSGTALGDTFDSWMLPSQFQALDDLAPGTWIVAEVDGSIALTLGAQYGYDFNWVREAVALGGLTGDIGLKVQVGLAASIGFEASGQYAIALGRALDSNKLRLQLFRLNRKGLNLAYSAGASAKGSFGGLLPDHFDDFVAGVFGLQGMQVLKDLEKWTAPGTKLSDLLADVGVTYAEDFLSKVTGIDARQEFTEARERLVNLLNAWHALPHRVATTVYSIVENEASGLAELKAQLKLLKDSDLVQFQPDLEKLLSHVDFFKTPFGKWLEAAAVTSVLNAASDTSEYARVQDIARQSLAVLDGSLLENTLKKLQADLASRLGLARIEEIIDQTTFDKADEWLKARLGAFLGAKVDTARVQQIREAIHKLLNLRQTLFAQAKKALTKKYEAQLLGSYQRATTRTALVDVTFDFGATDASPATLARLAASAVDGDFEQLLFTEIPGVALARGVMTHEVKRQSHLELTLPFLHVELDHINKSLAKLESVQSDRGRLVVYDLNADDLKTAKGKFASRFVVQGRFAQQGNTRVFDEVSMTHAYTFRQAMPMVRTGALTAQLKPYVDTYFPSTFGGGESSFQDWISDVDRTIERVLQNGPNDFGNTLLSLEVSAPAALVGAWTLAPASEKADQYFDMSRRIQAQLRKLVPLTYFQDPQKFKDRVPSAALLVYSALPVTTGIVVEGGRIMQFDGKEDVYPDIDSSGNTEALVRNSRTVASLVLQLGTVHAMLNQARDTQSFADDYNPSRVGQIISDALTPNGAADLRNLLLVERGVIRKGHAAGQEIAGFLKAKSAADALKCLADYGESVTTAFNSKIGGLFTGTELRPLGTLVFMEAGRALDRTLDAARPSAMLELTVLKDHPSFDLRSFVEGADVPAADIVNVQKFVSLA